MGFKKEGATYIDKNAISKATFSSQPTSTGLPNTIIFNYDLGNIEAEAAFIQQSWDKRLTFEVDKEGHEASAIYYYPGYFKAKLVVNDQIIQEHDIHVKTEGWMASIPGKDLPRYLYYGEIETNGALRINNQVFNELSNHALDKAQTLNFHYSEDMGEIFGSEFNFETRFRNTYRKSNGICQKTNITIHGSEGAIIIPFSIPGCVSDLEIFHVGETIDGKTNDLSAFGLDFDSRQTLRCESKDDKINFYINDKLVREMTVKNELGKIVGFRFSFSGAGEIDAVKLWRKNKIFYQEEFTTQ